MRIEVNHRRSVGSPERKFPIVIIPEVRPLVFQPVVIRDPLPYRKLVAERDLPNAVRWEFWRRREWRLMREGQLDELRFHAERGERWAQYKFFQWCQTLMHPKAWAEWRANYEFGYRQRFPGGNTTIPVYRTSLEEAIVAGAFYFDATNGNDLNDGMLVSEGGTGPWQNWTKFHTECEAGNFSPGDHIYFRSGNYQPADFMDGTGGGSSEQNNKITIEGYPSETATIDWSGAYSDANAITDRASAAENPIVHNSNYRWKRMHTNCQYACWGTIFDGTSQGCEWIGCTRTPFQDSTFGGNGGVVKIGNGSSEFLVEGCDFGTLTVTTPSGNDGVIYWIMVNFGTIRNNKARNSSSDGQVLHHKRSDMRSGSLGDITVDQNHLIASTEVISLDGTQFHLFRHNLVIWDGEGVTIEWGHTDANRPADVNNSWQHNTFACTASSPTFNSVTSSTSAGGQAAGAGVDSIFENNVVEGKTGVGTNQSSYDHNHTLDYNLYDISFTNPFREFSTDYANITDWRNETTNFAGGTHDQNSQTDNGIDWATARASRDIDTPSDFALAGTSNGSGASKTGTDMGADMDIVGPAFLGY